ncbi:MAG: glutathione S-transferase family protein [Gaiellaceae bacterium]
MHRLYHREGAGRPRRVRWAFEEAGAPYEWIVMDEETGRGEEHARRHPLGRVPVLESDDGRLHESAAICLHVADLNPGSGLIAATGSHDRGRIYQWSFFAMTELETAMIAAIRAKRSDDEAATTAAQARLAKAVAALEETLAGHDYLLGDEFTIADVIVGGVCFSARQYDVLPDAPNVAAYLERLDARPAKQRAYDDQP